jgi:uncharacterized protein YaaR (DUF327 family)
MIFKKGNIVTSSFLDEGKKFFMILFSLSRESYDKVGSYEMSREIFLNIFQEFIDLLFIVKSSHTFEQGRANMLQRDIKIGDKLLRFCQLLEILDAQKIRIEVEESIGEISRNFINFFE